MVSSGSTRAGFLPARVIHLHASRFCNLACKHCYSASGPHHRDGLRHELIVAALPLLRQEGYEVLSISGGEPLLYTGFESVVRAAFQLGFRINLISNGAPIGGRLLDIIGEYVNLVAISLDGAPATHVEMRGNAHAFAWAQRALERLATTDTTYGVAYCVSQRSLTDMPWAAEFAAKIGASIVQFHPFAPVGRGRTLSDRFDLSEFDKARAYVLAALLDTGAKPAIQIDYAPVEALRSSRDDYAILHHVGDGKLLLADLVNPLIVDESGYLLPFAYGINPKYSIGQIGPELKQLINGFKRSGWRETCSLLSAAFESLGEHGERLTDWFYHVVQTSYRISGGGLEYEHDS